LPGWLGIGPYACRTFEPNGSPKVRACTLALAAGDLSVKANEGMCPGSCAATMGL